MLCVCARVCVFFTPGQLRLLGGRMLEVLADKGARRARGEKGEGTRKERKERKEGQGSILIPNRDTC